MPTYSITYKPSAAKASRKVHPNERKRIKEAIEGVATDSRPHGYIQPSGDEGECRIRIDKDCVVYDIEDDELVIPVMRIGHRRDVYR